MEASRAGRDEAPVVICYDGSVEAAEALEFVSQLLPGTPAIVVSVWKPVVEEALAAAGRQVPPISDIAEGSEREHHTAVGLAREGAQRAAEAGLEADAQRPGATLEQAGTRGALIQGGRRAAAGDREALTPKSR